MLLTEEPNIAPLRESDYYKQEPSVSEIVAGWTDDFEDDYDINDEDFDDEFDDDFEELPDGEFEEFDDLEDEEIDVPGLGDSDEPLDDDESIDDFDDLATDENTFDTEDDESE